MQLILEFAVLLSGGVADMNDVVEMLEVVDDIHAVRECPAKIQVGLWHFTSSASFLLASTSTLQPAPEMNLADQSFGLTSHKSS